MLPFPSLSELNSLLPDHRLDQATYSAAKQLYETRQPPPQLGNTKAAAEFHMRDCVQIAISGNFLNQNFAPAKKHVNYAS